MKISVENFKANRKVLIRQNQKMTQKPRKDFWSIQGDFICRHHSQPRVQLCEPKEDSFPIPLKYIDVTRATFTNLDVLQEKRTDDYWKVRRESKFIRFLERIHKVLFIERETSRRIFVVRVETDKNSSKDQT